MLRYFIAIEPPSEQRLRIAEVMRHFGDPWPVPHITLKSPVGLTPDLQWLPDVRATVAHCARFSVTIGPVGTFDNRVLFLSVEGSGLGRVHRSILDVLSPGGDPDGRFSDERDFMPHLTLWVSRGKQELPPFEQWTSTLQNLDPFEATELIVFRRDDPSTHYQAWARLPLAH